MISLETNALAFALTKSSPDRASEAESSTHIGVAVPRHINGNLGNPRNKMLLHAQQTALMHNPIQQPPRNVASASCISKIYDQAIKQLESSHIRAADPDIAMATLFTSATKGLLCAEQAALEHDPPQMPVNNAAPPRRTNCLQSRAQEIREFAVLGE